MNLFRQPPSTPLLPPPPLSLSPPLSAPQPNHPFWPPCWPERGPSSLSQLPRRSARHYVAAPIPPPTACHTCPTHPFTCFPMTSMRSPHPWLQPNQVTRHRKRHHPGQRDSRIQATKHWLLSLHLFDAALFCFHLPPLFLPFLLPPAWISLHHFSDFITSPFLHFFSAGWLHSFTPSVRQHSCCCSFTPPFLSCVNAWILHTCLQSSPCFPVSWHFFSSFKSVTSMVVSSQMVPQLCTCTSAPSCFLASSL